MREDMFEEALRSEAILNALPVGIIVLNAHTAQIAFVNESAKAILGLNQESPYQLIHTHSQQPYADHEFPMLRVLKTRSAADDEMTVLRPDGENVDLMVKTIPVFDRNRHL